MRAVDSHTVIERLEQRFLLHAGHSDFFVQFGTARTTPVDGYVVDVGATFGPRNDDMSFGWSRKGDAKPVARKPSELSPDARYDSFVNVKQGSSWELELPNGAYEVRVVAGDSKAKRAVYGIDVENVPAIRATTDTTSRWAEGTVIVDVTDGHLTITGAAEVKRNRLNFVEITHVDGSAGTQPPNGAPLPTPGRPSSLLPDGIFGEWSNGAPSPIARSEAVGAVVGDKVYVFGGISGRGANYAYPVTSRSDVYDPATDTWTRLADMPEPFTHSVGSVDGTTIWFVGGFIGNTPGPGTTHVWKYDTLTDTWSRGPDLPEARGGGASAIVGRTLHAFGGSNLDRTADMPTHWSLNLDDPAAAWVQRADMPTPRNHMAAATVAGKIYAVGGQRGEGDDAVDLAEVDVYDPITNAWTPVAPMPGPRSHTNCSTLEIDGKLIVIGGESGPETYESEILAYDPATGAWSTIGLLPEPRSTSIAGVVEGELVIATGNAPSQSTDVRIAPLT